MGRTTFVIPLAACFWLGVSALSEEPGKKPKKFTLPELQGVVLDEKEVPGLRFVQQNASHWWKGEAPDGEGLSQPSVIQEFRDRQDRLVVVKYARFPGSGEARRAADFHSKNMASVFRKGLWKGWEKKTIGDECWVVVASTGASLLVQEGTLCLRIGCHIDDAEEAQRLAFSLAEKILAKEAHRKKEEKALEAPKVKKPKKFTLPELESVVLDEKEVPELSLVNQIVFYWWKGERADGEVLSKLGVAQSLRDSQGRLVLARYARFSDSSKARRAAEYYPKNVAAVFRKGLWKGWEKKTIGDSCWVAVASTQAALLVQKGTLCLLIGCHIDDAEEAQRLAFSLAQKILPKEARRRKKEKALETPKGGKPKKFTLPELEWVVLNEKEMPEWNLVNQNVFYWWKGERADGEVFSKLGVSQAFRDSQGRRVFAGYARFSDSSKARHAAEYYPKNVASVFRKGLWKGWEKKTIGDSCWVSVASTRAALLVQKGTLCFLIGCHGVEKEEAQRLAFSLAEKILAKEARRKKKDKPPHSQKGPGSRQEAKQK